jgi:hypothetical protein
VGLLESGPVIGLADLLRVPAFKERVDSNMTGNRLLFVILVGRSKPTAVPYIMILTSVPEYLISDTVCVFISVILSFILSLQHLNDNNAFLI